MHCLHPFCPMGSGLSDWASVLDWPDLRIRPSDKGKLLAALTPVGHISGPLTLSPQLLTSAPFKRILEACPCLYAQLSVSVSARGVVHLCEITLGERIVSSNVVDAFDVQHPKRAPAFKYPPTVPGASGGDIMEALCSEVLENHGVPHMHRRSDGWPEWTSCCHVTLNKGRFHPLKLYGDILIPCAPHNLLVSVKSEAARERFIVSGNRLESVGFGFFADPAEFWTPSRMTLLKRWGFVAVYMPTPTLRAIDQKIASSTGLTHATNINGRPLYRDLANFGDDIKRVAGKLSSEI